MLDEEANQLIPGQPVLVTMTVSECYTGTGALLVEVREKNCLQRFWLPVAAIGPAEVAQ